MSEPHSVSNLHIALVAEGPTDHVIIEAALKAILSRPFVLTLLQPEQTRPDLGSGWGGVLKWCLEFSKRNFGSFAADPLFSQFDFIIVHLDADVAEKSYADCGAGIEAASKDLPPLPCGKSCPPPGDTVKELQAVMLGWLGIAGMDTKSVLCIPSKASEAWLAAAVLPLEHRLLSGIECRLDFETQLAGLSRSLKIRKSTREYRQRSATLSKEWASIKTLCSQAIAFENAIHAIVS